MEESAEADPTAAASPRVEPTALPAGLWVDASAVEAEISPLLYGTNYGPWMAVTVENLPAFQASGLKFIRFPGGRWGDSNNLRDYQVRLLMDYADMLEADVTISARLLDGTPDQAVELMNMVNEELGHDVRYWSIGNEPSLYIDLQKAELWDTVYYNEQWRIFAEAMKASDPDILLLGPNNHQFRADESLNPKDPAGLDWMREFLRANGDMVDVVTFHRYPFPISMTNPLPTVDELRENSREWDEIIPKIREIIREETGRDIPIGIMEINSNWSDAAGGEATPDSHYNAIWWGDVLARMIQHDVEMVTHFALQNKTAGWALLDRTTLRPTYYVYQLYSRFGEGRLASGSDDQYVNIVSARRQDGALTIMLINLADDPVTKPLLVDGQAEIELSERWVLAPEQLAENLGAETLTGEIILPAQSMTLLVVE
ncbi:MAG: hypothetical protein AAF633_16270 [Chloroflexota bacterium]